MKRAQTTSMSVPGPLHTHLRCPYLRIVSKQLDQLFLHMATSIKVLRSYNFYNQMIEVEAYVRPISNTLMTLGCFYVIKKVLVSRSIQIVYYANRTPLRCTLS